MATDYHMTPSLRIRSEEVKLFRDDPGGTQPQNVVAEPRGEPAAVRGAREDRRVAEAATAEDAMREGEVYVRFDGRPLKIGSPVIEMEWIAE